MDDKQIAEAKTKIRQLRQRIKNKENDFVPEAASLKELISKCNGPPDKLNATLFDSINCAMTRSSDYLTNLQTADEYLDLLEVASQASDRGYWTKKQSTRLLAWIEQITNAKLTSCLFCIFPHLFSMPMLMNFYKIQWEIILWNLKSRSRNQEQEMSKLQMNQAKSLEDYALQKLY